MTPCNEISLVFVHYMNRSVFPLSLNHIVFFDHFSSESNLYVPLIILKKTNTNLTFNGLKILLHLQTKKLT